MSIIKKPIITEKMTAISDKLGRYGFIVERKATKEQIKAVIEKLYNVEVDRVNTMIQPARRASKFTKTGFHTGRKPIYKKAIIKLKEGQVIDFFANV